MDQKCPLASEIRAFLSPPSPQKFSYFTLRRKRDPPPFPISLHVSSRQRRMFLSLLSKTALVLLLQEFQITMFFHTEWNIPS